MEDFTCFNFLREHTHTVCHRTTNDNDGDNDEVTKKEKKYSSYTPAMWYWLYAGDRSDGNVWAHAIRIFIAYRQ